LTYKIITDNYINSQHFDFSSLLLFTFALQKYNLVIGNPPYYKISIKLLEVFSMQKIWYGGPNIYCRLLVGLKPPALAGGVVIFSLF
jgi:hypothetical protein